MNAFLEAVRPVLFESDDAQFPYFGMGSSILLSTERHLYWVTAKHVMESQRGSAETLRIFPTEKSRLSIPFNLWVNVVGQSQDSDFTDLYILRVDLADFCASGDALISGQRVEDGLLDMATLKPDDELLVACFPNDHRAVDYKDFKIHYKRSTFKARFAGSSSSQHCGKMQIEGSHGLTTFNGVSGSPVYRLVTVEPLVIMPMIVGVVVRGTAESGIAHFIDAKVLRHAICGSESE